MNRIVGAILLIGFGILLLLVNINVISLEINEIFVTFYPVIIVLFGGKWLIESIISKGKKDWLGGFIFLLFGTLLILDRLEFIVFTFSMVWKLWPVLLIYVGIKYFSKSKKDKSVRKESIPIGSITNEEGEWTVEPMEVWTGIGNFHYDFSKAFIPDKETTINIEGLIGDVKMLIPEDVKFSVEARVKTGSIEICKHEAKGQHRRLTFTTPGYEEATRKLTINVVLKVGSIRIDRV
ncbi:cell wall-active antibiotics response protein LiaF [Bacillus timonensis]|nr:cell wall-active antibiotics response protein LiaF [Bacillus timonensis]